MNRSPSLRSRPISAEARRDELRDGVNGHKFTRHPDRPLLRGFPLPREESDRRGRRGSTLPVWRSTGDTRRSTDLRRLATAVFACTTLTSTGVDRALDALIAFLRAHIAHASVERCCPSPGPYAVAGRRLATQVAARGHGTHIAAPISMWRDCASRFAHYSGGSSTPILLEDAARSTARHRIGRSTVVAAHRVVEVVRRDDDLAVGRLHRRKARERKRPCAFASRHHTPRCRRAAAPAGRCRSASRESPCRARSGTRASARCPWCAPA